MLGLWSRVRSWDVRGAAPGASGRAAIEWGVYGVPETYVIGRSGKILFKLVGPITPDNIDTVLKAQIDKALAAES